ncbi:MAG: hypothetical protein ACETWG_07325 [Candidatus Neomarinimicrobiota bacterium]
MDDPAQVKQPHEYRQPELENGHSQTALEQLSQSRDNQTGKSR